LQSKICVFLRSFLFSPVRARDANGWLRFSSVRAFMKKFELR